MSGSPGSTPTRGGLARSSSARFGSFFSSSKSSTSGSPEVSPSKPSMFSSLISRSPSFLAPATPTAASASDSSPKNEESPSRQDAAANDERESQMWELRMQIKESEIDLLRLKLATSEDAVRQLRDEIHDFEMRAERENSKWQKAYDSLADANASTEQELLSAKSELNDARQSEARRIEEEEKKAKTREKMRSTRTWHLNSAEFDSKLTRLKDRIAIANG